MVTINSVSTKSGAVHDALFSPTDVVIEAETVYDTIFIGPKFTCISTGYSGDSGVGKFLHTRRDVMLRTKSPSSFLRIASLLSLIALMHLLLPQSPAGADQWRQKGNTQAVDIGAGGRDRTSNRVCIISTVDEEVGSRNKMVYCWSGRAWVPESAAGLRIAVDINGWMWVVNDSGEVHYQKSGGGTMARITDNVTDIGAGGQITQGHTALLYVGSVGLIGDQEGNSGKYPIRLGVYDDERGRPQMNWRPIGGEADRIAVGYDLTVWVVNSNKDIYVSYGGGGFQLVDGGGKAKDIGAGGVSGGAAHTFARSPCFIIGQYGLSVWRYDPNSQPMPWVPVTVRQPPLHEPALAITVDWEGRPWIVSASGYVYRYEP